MILRVRHGGTEVRIGPAGVVTRLPSGDVIRARPNAESAAMADRLGYGADVKALTSDHDPLHVWLANVCGLPSSAALSAVAAHRSGDRLAALEEAAVLAVQAYCRAAGLQPWRCSTP